MDFYDGRVTNKPHIMEVMEADKEQAIESTLSIIDFVEDVLSNTETSSETIYIFKRLRLMIQSQYFDDDIKTLRLSNDMVETFPKLFIGYKTRAKTYAKLNNFNLACKDYNAALSLTDLEENIKNYYPEYVYNQEVNHYQKGYDLKTLNNIINSKIKEICK